MPVWLKFGSPNFFYESYIVAGYDRIQFQEKPMIKIQENSKKRHFGPDLGLVDPNSGHQNFFIKLIVRH